MLAALRMRHSSTAGVAIRRWQALLRGVVRDAGARDAAHPKMRRPSHQILSTKPMRADESNASPVHQ
jgi:hypothetical protein